MSDFTTDDYIQIRNEIDYYYHVINMLDEKNLAHASKICELWERIEYLEDLLNKYRAQVAREGFKLIKGGRY